MEFKGIVTLRGEETEVGQNATPKMTIVVEETYDKQYKDSLAVDFIGEEKVANARSVNVGDEVTVLYNTKASEYNGKVYNNIRGWQIRKSKTKLASETNVDEDLPF